MKPNLLPDLVERLERGDDRAAEELFVAYEPYLRVVVRRQLSPRLRAKFDSLDVVHSVWVDVLERFRQGNCHFADTVHLRNFLVRATRNRFIDRLRRHQTETEPPSPMFQVQAETREVSIPAPPRPSEVAQAKDVWDKLLTLCPPGHREILRLKREGLALHDIAAQTGMHPSSIRRILYELARRLSADQEPALATATSS